MLCLSHIPLTELEVVYFDTYVVVVVVVTLGWVYVTHFVQLDNDAGAW